MRRFLVRAGRFLAQALLIDVGTAALTGVACWLLGWRSWDQYGIALVGAGFLALVLAGPSFFGSAMVLGNPITWYVQSVMPGTPRQRWRALLDDSNAESLSSSLMVVVGFSLMGAGASLWSLT